MGECSSCSLVTAATTGQAHRCYCPRVQLNGNCFTVERRNELVASLTELASLQTLYLEGNPLATTDDYFEFFTGALPALQQLDAIRIRYNP